MYWLRKHSWLITLIFTFLMLALQVFSYIGLQFKQWSFLTRRFLSLSFFEITIIILAVGLIAFRLGYRSVAKRSDPLLTGEDIQKIKHRVEKVDNMKSQWQQVLNSVALMETESLPVREVEVDSPFGFATGSRFVTVHRHFIKDNCEFRLLFDKTKSYTVTELEAIAKDQSKVENYVKEIRDIRISGDFESQVGAVEHAENQSRRIIAILENIKKSISE